MNRSAARAILLALPFLALAFYVLTRTLPPLTGYAAGLAVYWIVILIPLILRHRERLPPRRIDWPGAMVGGLSVVMLVGVAGAAIGAATAPEAHLPLAVLIAVVLAALCNGSLEELFWRGVMLDDAATPREQVYVLAMFVAWHLALLFAYDVTLTGGPAALLAGALVLGGLLTLARQQTGSLGFAILVHVGLNLFAFTELAFKNVDKV